MNFFLDRPSFLWRWHTAIFLGTLSTCCITGWDIQHSGHVLTSTGQFEDRPVFEELHHHLRGIFCSFLFYEILLASLQRVIHDSCELMLQAMIFTARSDMRTRCPVRLACRGMDFEIVCEKARETKTDSSFVSTNSSSCYRNYVNISRT